MTNTIEGVGIEMAKVLDWVKANDAQRISIRIKGVAKPYEGWELMDTTTHVFVVKEDGMIVGGRHKDVEAVWFLSRWMSPDEFDNLK